MATLLDGQALFDEHQFENALPIPEVIDATNGRNITLQVRETTQFLGLYDSDGQELYTTVWGYGTGAGNTSYPGPTILAYEGVPITVHWQNKLPLTGHLLPVDTTLDFAESESHPLKDGYVPIVTHLHGGHNDSIFDGLPDQWFTQSGGGNGPRGVGPGFVTSTMTYDNSQQAATLWYHDHALGITRLNVYAGLAGFYLLQDENIQNLISTGVLPSGPYEIGMAIQDRAFTADGQLYYPAYKDDFLPGTDNQVGVGNDPVVPQAFYDEFGENAPSAVPEFFGDVIVVNGMAWPNLTVAAGDYEFHLLNGSDSRFYVLKLSDPDVKVDLVGVDGGLLSSPQTIMDGDGLQEPGEFLVLAPGDRVDLVFDFSDPDVDPAVQLLNIGPAFEPFKGLADSLGSLAGDATAATSDDSVGSIMQFTLDSTLAPFNATLTSTTVLNPNFQNIAEDTDGNGIADVATNVRLLGLFEGVDEWGRIQPLLGTAKPGDLHTDINTPDGDFGPLAFGAPTTEMPLLGSTEQWDIFNFTADSHPIHVHLTQFQVVEKHQIYFEDLEDLDGDGFADGNGIPDDHGDGISYMSVTNFQDQDDDGIPDQVDYSVADIWIDDRVITLRPEETGWQDTAWVDPNQMMSIVATFDKPGDYVWHCHILSHEDNEMMRPYTVVDDASLLA